MINSVGFIPNNPHITNNPVPSKHKIPTLWHRVQEVAERLFIDFKKIAWKPIDKTKSILVKSLKVTKAVKPIIKQKINKAIGVIGILSLVNILLVFDDAADRVKSLIQNIHLKDAEGTVLSVLSLLASPLELLDELDAFISGLSVLNAIPVIAFFSIIAIPIGLTLLTYGVVKGTYELTHFAVQTYQIPDEVKTEGDLKKLKEYLHSKVGDETNEYIMRRRTDARIVGIMKDMLKSDQFSMDNLSKVNASLKDMKTIAVRKLSIKGAGIFVNLAMISAIAAALIFPPAALIALPVVSLVRALWSFVTMTLNDHYVYSGLTNIDWKQSNNFNELPFNGLDAESLRNEYI